MNQQNTPPYFKDIIRIFSFFKEYVNVTDFSIEEIQFNLESQNTYLLQYLMTQLFEDIYQTFQEKGNLMPIFKLFADNKCVRQCQLWDAWPTIYSELALYFDKISKRKSNQEVLDLLFDDFTRLNFEQKKLILLHFINTYSLQLDHIKEQIRYNQDLLKELPANPQLYQKSREQWQMKLDSLQGEIQSLDCEQKYPKMKYQQSKKKNDELLIQKQNLESLMELNYEICLLFQFNQLAVLYRGKNMDLLVFRHLPNRLIVNTSQGYQEYYGDDAFAFVQKQEIKIDMSYFCRTLRKLPNPIIRTDFLVLDQTSKKEYRQFGDTKFLVYGKFVCLDLIVQIILSIEEKVSRYFLEQYDMVWGSKFQREQWKEKVKLMKEEEQITYAVNSLIPTLRQMHFVENGENSDGSYESKRFFGQFKKYSFDMNQSNYLQIMCIYWIVITQLRTKTYENSQNIIDSDDDD